MIETIVLGILFSLTIIYVGAALYAFRGLTTLTSTLTDTMHSFSIIVAARNEERNIASLLHSLMNLEYPKERYEIIIVNDRSTDATAEIVTNSAAQADNITLISPTENNSDMPNKKHALGIGIRHAHNPILAFTDADCVVPATWLKRLSEQFTDDVGLVAGYSPYMFGEPKRWFNSFLRYDELKSTIFAAAAVGCNHAYMCTGRNVAYRKTVYEQVGGFEKIKHSISGDDDLFLQLVQQTTQWKIRYMTQPSSYVYTQPPTNLRSFINQRIRHISASKYYPLNIKALFGSAHLLLIVTLLSLLSMPLYGLIAVLVRINVDALLVAKAKELFNEEFSVVEFFRNELLLISYTLLIGPFGLVKKFEWKGTVS